MHRNVLGHLVSRWSAVSVASLVLCTSQAFAQYGITLRSSNGAASRDGNGGSYAPSISADGRFIAFQSSASNLLPPGVDTNGVTDVFVLDRQSGVISRVSVGFGGQESDNSSLQPSISDDGDRIAFVSAAANLVLNDFNFEWDVFVYERSSGTTWRVSVDSTGNEAIGPSDFPAISGDGTRVAFESADSTLAPLDNNGNCDVFWHDIASGATQLVSRSLTGSSGIGASGCDGHAGPSINRDGTQVAFWSRAADLVAGDTNGQTQPPCITCGDDVFVCDVLTGTIVRVSETSGGGQANNVSNGPSLSRSGRFVAFQSRASNLVSGDSNGFTDIFVRDRDSDADGIFDEPGAVATLRVSVAADGTQANNLSGGGGFGWRGPAISRDGSRVAFHSRATNLDGVDNNGLDYDVFVSEIATGAMLRASIDGDGVAGSGRSISPALSADGRRIVFASDASNLGTHDVNGAFDIYERIECETPRTYCTAKLNSLGCTPAISFTGVPSIALPVAFELRASMLLNNSQGVLLYSTIGAAAAPFQGGYLCMQAPTTRTPLKSTGGSASGVDCTGVLSFEFNAYAASGVNPALVSGADVWVQFWSRDGGASFGTSLTAALAFTLSPP